MKAQAVESNLTIGKSLRKLLRKKRLNCFEDVDGIESFRNDEFKVVRLIGEGGFASVFEIVHQQSSSTESDSAKSIVQPRHFAMKIVRYDRLDNKRLHKVAASDLINETKILSLLNHPNIVRLRAIPRHSHDSHFLVLDLLRDTLSERIQRWHAESHEQHQIFPWKMDYAYQMALALEYLHSKHIIFRDLKPENVGFKDQHTVQLFDFGLARQLKTLSSCESETSVSSCDTSYQEKTFRLTRCGTLRYSAPEIVISGLYCLKSDCYSFGLVFWEMLTEVKPFHYMSPSVHKILVCQRGERPPIYNYNFPWDVKELLTQCWEGRICDRLSIAQVCDRLLALLENSAMIVVPGARFKSKFRVDWESTTESGGDLFSGKEVGIEVEPIWMPEYLQKESGVALIQATEASRKQF